MTESTTFPRWMEVEGRLDPKVLLTSTAWETISYYPFVRDMTLPVIPVSLINRALTEKWFETEPGQPLGCIALLLVRVPHEGGKERWLLGQVFCAPHQQRVELKKAYNGIRARAILHPKKTFCSLVDLYPDSKSATTYGVGGDIEPNVVWMAGGPRNHTVELADIRVIRTLLAGPFFHNKPKVLMPSPLGGDSRGTATAVYPKPAHPKWIQNEYLRIFFEEGYQGIDEYTKGSVEVNLPHLGRDISGEVLTDWQPANHPYRRDSIEGPDVPPQEGDNVLNGQPQSADEVQVVEKGDDVSIFIPSKGKGKPKSSEPKSSASVVDLTEEESGKSATETEEEPQLVDSEKPSSSTGAVAGSEPPELSSVPESGEVPVNTDKGENTPTPSASQAENPATEAGEPETEGPADKANDEVFEAAEGSSKGGGEQAVTANKPPATARAAPSDEKLEFFPRGHDPKRPGGPLPEDWKALFLRLYAERKAYYANVADVSGEWDRSAEISLRHPADLQKTAQAEVQTLLQTQAAALRKLQEDHLAARERLETSFQVTLQAMQAQHREALENLRQRSEAEVSQARLDAALEITEERRKQDNYLKHVRARYEAVMAYIRNSPEWEDNLVDVAPMMLEAPLGAAPELILGSNPALQAELANSIAALSKDFEQRETDLQNRTLQVAGLEEVAQNAQKEARQAEKDANEILEQFQVSLERVKAFGIRNLQTVLSWPVCPDVSQIVQGGTFFLAPRDTSSPGLDLSSKATTGGQSVLDSRPVASSTPSEKRVAASGSASKPNLASANRAPTGRRSGAARASKVAAAARIAKDSQDEADDDDGGAIVLDDDDEDMTSPEKAVKEEREERQDGTYEPPEDDDDMQEGDHHGRGRSTRQRASNTKRSGSADSSASNAGKRARLQQVSRGQSVLDSSQDDLNESTGQAYTVAEGRDLAFNRDNDIINNYRKTLLEKNPELFTNEDDAAAQKADHSMVVELCFAADKAEDVQSVLSDYRGDDPQLARIHDYLKRKTPHQFFVVQDWTPKMKDIGLASIHDGEAFNQISCLVSTETGERRVIKVGFCPFCPFHRSNQVVVNTHVRHHLRLAVISQCKQHLCTSYEMWTKHNKSECGPSVCNLHPKYTGSSRIH